MLYLILENQNLFPFLLCSSDLEKPSISLAPGYSLPVTEKENITIICKASDTSLAENSIAYRWTKDGSSTITISEMSALTLIDVKRQDAGNYNCEAYNTTYSLSTNETIFVSMLCKCDSPPQSPYIEFIPVQSMKTSEVFTLHPGIEI